MNALALTPLIVPVVDHRDRDVLAVRPVADQRLAARARARPHRPRAAVRRRQRRHVACGRWTATSSWPPRTSARTRAGRFLRITLPIILPGVLAGAIFSFITSWDEVVVAIFLTSARFRTLPVEMWEQVRQVVDPTVAAVSTTLLVVTTVLLLLLLVVRRQAPAR